MFCLNLLCWRNGFLHNFGGNRSVLSCGTGTAMNLEARIQEYGVWTQVGADEGKLFRASGDRGNFARFRKGIAPCGSDVPRTEFRCLTFETLLRIFTLLEEGFFSQFWRRIWRVLGCGTWTGIES